MQVGINCISPETLPLVHELVEQGIAEFCEIMVDNFVHLPAKEILTAFPQAPITLHIVASRFLEKSVDELKNLADVLRPWIKELQPMHVSDHLAKFSSNDGGRLLFPVELDYQQSYAHIKEHVCLWQDMLDTQLLFENHASLTAAGNDQPQFFSKLLAETNAGLLFDFSNAYIAQQNGFCKASLWDALLPNTKHFHAAGFHAHDKAKLIIDTHDRQIDAAVWALMQAKRTYLQHASIVVEFDAKMTIEKWTNDVNKIKNELSTEHNHSASIAPPRVCANA